MRQSVTEGKAVSLLKAQLAATALSELRARTRGGGRSCSRASCSACNS
jgi:hypothetical protein